MPHWFILLKNKNKGPFPQILARIIIWFLILAILTGMRHSFRVVFIWISPCNWGCWKLWRHSIHYSFVFFLSRAQWLVSWSIYWLDCLVFWCSVFLALCLFYMLTPSQMDIWQGFFLHNEGCLFARKQFLLMYRGFIFSWNFVCLSFSESPFFFFILYCFIN